VTTASLTLRKQNRLRVLRWVLRKVRREKVEVTGDWRKLLHVFTIGTAYKLSKRMADRTGVYRVW